MRRLPRTLMAAAGISVMLLASACSGDDGSNDDEGTSTEPDQVTYVTGFGLFGRDAWIYCIIDQGLFEEQNIEVTVEPGSGTEGNFALLLGGQAQFTVTDMVGNLIALGEGTTGWKAVSALQQNNLSTWMTLDPELATPQDLEGETIALPPGAVTNLLFPTYAELAGANPDEITIEPVDGTELAGTLVSGNAAAIGQFATGLPGIQAAAEGQEVYVHPYTDVLTDLYGQALVTTDEQIANDPDLVRRFNDAFLEGLAWSMDNSEQCGEIMGEVQDVQPPEVAGREIALMDPYARVGNTPLGHFDEQRLVRMVATLEAAGAIPAGITPDQFVDFSFGPQA